MEDNCNDTGKTIWPSFSGKNCEMYCADQDDLCMVCGQGFVDTGSLCMDNLWLFSFIVEAALVIVIILVITIVCLAVKGCNKDQEIAKLLEEGANRSLSSFDDDTDVDKSKSPTEEGELEDRYVNHLPTDPVAHGEEEEMYEPMPGVDITQTDDKPKDESPKQNAGPPKVEEEEGERDSTYDDVTLEAYVNKGFQGDIPKDFEPNLANVDTKKDYFPWSKLKAQQELKKTASHQVERREVNGRPTRSSRLEATQSGEYTPIDD